MLLRAMARARELYDDGASDDRANGGRHGGRAGGSAGVSGRDTRGRHRSGRVGLCGPWPWWVVAIVMVVVLARGAYLVSYLSPSYIKSRVAQEKERNAADRPVHGPRGIMYPYKPKPTESASAEAVRAQQQPTSPSSSFSSSHILIFSSLPVSELAASTLISLTSVYERRVGSV